MCNEYSLNSMFKSFAFVLISTQIMLKIDEVTAVPGDSETEENDISKEGDEMKKPFPQQEQSWFSLNCVLFKDLGCDSECFVIADAFGYLGAGVCVDDNRCNCGYAIKPTLKGTWKQKFPDSGEILDQIVESNAKLGEKIRIALSQGFKTSLKSKFDLKPYFSDEQFVKLEATNTIPADQFIRVLSGTYEWDEIHNHVNDKLFIALKWREADLTAAHSRYKRRLIEALDNAKMKSRTELERIVHSVRRVNHQPLIDIVVKYLERNKIEVGPTRVDTDIIDKITSAVVEELVKRVDKGTFQFVVGWITIKFTSLLNNFRTTDNDRSVSEVLATPGPISHDWRKHGITIRYRRNQQGDINLAWVKNSDRVCILFDDEEAAVSQSWMFGGKVIISLFKSRHGGFTQYWKFGSFSYYKYDGGPSEGEWSNGKPYEVILKEYKTRIDEWCRDNNFLIDTKFCIIYAL